EHLDREVQCIAQELDEIHFERRRSRVAIEVAHADSPDAIISLFSQGWVTEFFRNLGYRLQGYRAAAEGVRVVARNERESSTQVRYSSTCLSRSRSERLWAAARRRATSSASSRP